MKRSSAVCVFFKKKYDRRIKTEQKLQQGIHLRFPIPEGFSLGNYLPCMTAIMRANICKKFY
jgi:hypothetical protein